MNSPNFPLILKVYKAKDKIKPVMNLNLSLLWELYSTLFKIGLCTFGGGIAMLPVLDRELAQKRKWTTSEELLDWFAIGQSTPGIIAVNVSTFIGNKLAGTIGGIIGTLGMITPSIIVISIIARFISNFAHIPWVQTALTGINISVAALLTHAVWKFATKAVKNFFGFVLFVLSFIAIYFFNVSTVWIIVVSVAIGVLTGALQKQYPLKPVLIGILISALAVIALNYGINALKGFASGETVIAVTEGQKIPLYQLFFIFMYVGLITIGGGLVAITVMQQLLVEKFALIGIDMFYNMVAVSESTPGPMGINMATYIGFELYGPGGAIITTLGQAAPSIICILIIARFFGKFADRAGVKAVFSALRPSVTGVIAVAAVKVFVLALLNIPEAGLCAFSQAETWKNLVKIPALLFYLAACFCLFKTKIHPILIVLAGALFAVLMTLL